MSEVNVNSEYSGGIRTTHYEGKNIFLSNNSFANGEMNNSDYDPVTIPYGTLLGRVSATNMLVPHDSAAIDGSQFPVGVLAKTYTIQDGDTVEVRFCTAGEVNENAIILTTGDTFDTVISSRTIRDRIGSDTVGIVLCNVTELSEFDN